MNDMSEVMQATQEASALTVIRAALPTILQADTNDILGKLADRIAAHKPDPASHNGREEIRKLSAECRRVKAELDRLGKGLTEEWRKSTAAVNAERRVVEERLDALAVQVRQPLTDFENREKDRVAGHEQAIADIMAWAAVPADWTAAAIDARMKELAAHPHREREWQEFRERAQEAARNSFNALKVARVEAMEREAAAAREAEEARIAAEAEASRQEQARIEREARIAAEAAEGARMAAEAEASRKAEEAARREREHAEALAAAEREKAAAIEAARQAEERHKAEAVAAEKRAQGEASRREAAAIEAERKRQADETARLQRETAAREANKAHRTQINREALAPLILLGLTEDQGKAVISAIAKGEVPHVTISY